MNDLRILRVIFPLCMIRLVSSLRCYTDVSATKSKSVECGLNTGCVKIYIDSEDMMMRRQQSYGVPPGADGFPELPEKYRNNPVMLRGCFVLAVPDICYTAKNGLSYCWCSTKDLCNRGTRPEMTSMTTLPLLLCFLLAFTSKISKLFL